MGFDLSNYMTAEERIELFAKDNPDFRYEVQHEFEKDSSSEVWVIVKVILWRTEVDPNPWVMGLAGENMKVPFAIEKAETSAFARAITNTGKPQFSTTKTGEKAPRANRAEMIKVSELPMYGARGSRSAAVEHVLRESFKKNQDESRTENKPEPVVWSVGDAIEVLSVAKPAPQECKHGAMILKEGLQKATGSPFYGYVCAAPRPEQCPAKWAKVTSAGGWFFPEDVERAE